MILKDNFYSILQWETENSSIRATITLNEKHAIFQGHFPGQPIVPGVCMIQIVKEVLESASGVNLLLKQADAIKFLAFIDPVKERMVQVNVQFAITDSENLHTTATLHCDEKLCFKFKGVFVYALLP